MQCGRESPPHHTELSAFEEEEKEEGKCKEHAGHWEWEATSEGDTWAVTLTVQWLCST